MLSGIGTCSETLCCSVWLCEVWTLNRVGDNWLELVVCVFLLSRHVVFNNMSTVSLCNEIWEEERYVDRDGCGEEKSGLLCSEHD